MLTKKRRNPLNEARWLRFKENRRGYWSLWIFMVLFVMSLFAELIANDKPLLVEYNNQWYYPIAEQYAETEFGGEFETEADYTDPYVIDLIEEQGYIIWPVIPFSYDTINFDIQGSVPSAPDDVNWLGTDDKGRDVLARIIYGFRISVLFGFVLTIVSSIIGVAVGATQGYYGGWLDLFGQRFIEVWSGMPTLFLLIILSSFAVTLGRLHLQNPIMVASGTFGYAREMEGIVDVSRLGAVLPKTITAEPRIGNAPWRTVETSAGLLNDPPKVPIAVRAPESMTMSFMPIPSKIC